MRCYDGDDASRSPDKVCRVRANYQQSAFLVHTRSFLSVSTRLDDGNSISASHAPVILPVFYHSLCT
jgi:hypothetical protein